MKKREPISHVMSTEVKAVQKGMRISEAYACLKEMPFHHLPVVDGRTPVGMVSSSDLLRLAYGAEGSDERTISAMLDHQFTLEDAMTTDLVTLTESATVRDAAAALADGDSHSVVVVDDKGDLAGIVTTTDLVTFLRDL